MDLVKQFVSCSKFKNQIKFTCAFTKKEEGYNRVLVFARTRETAENIHRYLNRMDVGVWKAIHANKGQYTTKRL